MFALVSLVSSSATSSDTCPAGWNQQVGACLWPKQHSYKTVDVSSAPDQSAACCGACAAEADECVSWLVYSAQHSGYDAGTCILNNQTVTGTPPALPICTIGFHPSASWPPTPAPAPAPAGAKNVLFFAVDDLRPDINSFGGVPGTHAPPLHTPNIDALAAMSLVLTKNYVQQAVCSPTRQSILTSRRPDRTRVYDLYSNFRTVAANYTTIPEFFMHHGYKTHGMGKIFHPGHASGDAPGMGGGDGSYMIVYAYENDIVLQPAVGSPTPRSLALSHTSPSLSHTVPLSLPSQTNAARGPTSTRPRTSTLLMTNTGIARRQARGTAAKLRSPSTPRQRRSSPYQITKPRITQSRRSSGWRSLSRQRATINRGSLLSVFTSRISRSLRVRSFLTCTP